MRGKWCSHETPKETRTFILKGRTHIAICCILQHTVCLYFFPMCEYLWFNLDLQPNSHNNDPRGTFSQQANKLWGLMSSLKMAYWSKLCSNLVGLIFFENYIQWALIWQKLLREKYGRPFVIGDSICNTNT